MNYVLRVGMNSTSINRFGAYLQNEKKLKVPVTRTVAEDERVAYRSRQSVGYGLSDQLKQTSGDKELLSPGDHDATKVMSENTVNSALRTMGYDTKTEVCAHGFRTMVRGALGELGLWSDDEIERQLSHSERNNVRAAYIHTS